MLVRERFTKLPCVVIDSSRPKMHGSSGISITMRLCLGLDQSALSGTARRSSQVITSSGYSKKIARPSCSTLRRAGKSIEYLYCKFLSLRLASVKNLPMALYFCREVWENSHFNIPYWEIALLSHHPQSCISIFVIKEFSYERARGSSLRGGVFLACDVPSPAQT